MLAQKLIFKKLICYNKLIIRHNNLVTCYFKLAIWYNKLQTTSEKKTQKDILHGAVLISNVQLESISLFWRRQHIAAKDFAVKFRPSYIRSAPIRSLSRKGSLSRHTGPAQRPWKLMKIYRHLNDVQYNVKHSTYCQRSRFHFPRDISMTIQI